MAKQILLDKEGKPIDRNGNLIGWPYRTGQLEMINGQRLAVKSLLIEVKISSQATPVNTYNVPDQPVLRNAAIWGIEFFSTATIAISPLSSLALVTQAMMAYMFFNAQDYDSYNFFQNKPCRTLQTINDTASKAGKSYSDGLVGQHINWPNCNIFFSDATQIAANTQYSILMEVLYSLENNWQADGLGKDFGSRS